MIHIESRFGFFYECYYIFTVNKTFLTSIYLLVIQFRREIWMPAYLNSQNFDLEYYMLYFLLKGNYDCQHSCEFVSDCRAGCLLIVHCIIRMSIFVIHIYYISQNVKSFDMVKEIKLKHLIQKSLEYIFNMLKFGPINKRVIRIMSYQYSI